MRLGTRALEVLTALVQRPGTIIEKQELMSLVWSDTSVDDSNLKVHIAALRKALDEDRSQSSCIATVTGRGYRFVQPVLDWTIAHSTNPCSITSRTDMTRSYETITLQDAKQMLAAAEAKAESIGIAYNIAVVDAGGHLLAFLRQDGALIGSIDLAIDKAVTARLFDMSTSDLATLAQSGKPLFGIQESNGGKVIIFAGGIPIRFNGSIVGAVGTSAGTVEQDIAVAEAAAAALTSIDRTSDSFIERG